MGCTDISAQFRPGGTCVSANLCNRRRHACYAYALADQSERATARRIQSSPPGTSGGECGMGSLARAAPSWIRPSPGGPDLACLLRTHRGRATALPRGLIKFADSYSLYTQ